MDLDKRSGQKASHVGPFSWFWDTFLAGVFLDMDTQSTSKTHQLKNYPKTTPIKAYS